MQFTEPLWWRLPEERKHFLSGFRPLVHFVMPDNSEPHETHRALPKLLSEFVLWCDPVKNAGQAEVMSYRGGQWNGEEGGIGQFYVDGEYIMSCKMYMFDGSEETARSPLENYTPWRGVMFRDHGESDCRLRNTVKVFLIADAFEKFLTERGIQFTRRNMEA